MGTGFPGVGATWAKRDEKVWRLGCGAARLSATGRVIIPTEKGLGWGVEVCADRKAAFAAWF